MIKFNTIFHSEDYIAKLATVCLLPPLILAELHKTKQSSPRLLPQNFDDAYAALSRQTSAAPRFGRLSRWQWLLNDFINQATELLTLSSSTTRVLPASAPLTMHLEARSKTSDILLDASKTILDNCLELLREIRTLRLAWRAELTQYLNSINDYIDQSNAGTGTLTQLRRALRHSTVPNMQYAISSGGKVAITVDRAKTMVTDTQTAMANMRDPTSIQAASAEVLAKNEFLSARGPGIANLEEQVKLEEGTFNWLNKFQKNFPESRFTLDHCLNLTMISERKTIKVFKDTVSSASAAANLAPQFSYETIDVVKAPWLYEFANIHIISVAIQTEYTALIQHFSLEEASKWRSIKTALESVLA
ncbi:MAG: hypothetical protein EXR81_05290, partial [Gammaproteobacteria bacterium]|nr:hypothetical protein [Gammaproteobacteria bacterium]